MTALRLRKKITICFSLVFCVWLAGLVWFVRQIPSEIKEFPANSADAIVVLTGGSGRLEYGLQLLAENKAKTLFISGAGAKVSVADIINQAPKNYRAKIAKSRIILGHMAENTIGNAQETAEWLEKARYHKILLVTSDYHTPRAMLELSEQLKTVQIIAAPVSENKIYLYKWLEDAESRALILSEYHKYIASKSRHLFVSITKAK